MSSLALPVNYNSDDDPGVVLDSNITNEEWMAFKTDQVLWRQEQGKAQFCTSEPGTSSVAIPGSRSLKRKEEVEPDPSVLCLSRRSQA